MAKAETERVAEVKIKKLNTDRIILHIQGLAPGLLVNAYSGTEKLSPDERFKQCRHYLGEGRDGALEGFPASGIKAAMVKAGYRAAKPQLAMTETTANIFVLHGADGLLPILAGDPVIHRSTIISQQGRGGPKAVEVTRACYADWGMDVPLQWNTERFSADDIGNLLDLAGFVQGIESWRPENDGQYGRFRVVEK